MDINFEGLLKEVPAFAGVLALAAFAGTFLGGLLLSFFWKHFGPWKMLAEVKAECEQCHKDRLEDQKDREAATRTNERAHLVMQAELSDYKARHDIIMEAIHRGGLGLKLVPNLTEMSSNH